MTDSLTASIARLYRAGSEYSQEAEKLRQSADALIDWLLKNRLDNIDLPMRCRVWPSGEFKGGYTPPFGKFRGLHLQRGQPHHRSQLLLFSQLIADGFLDRLSEQLEEEAETFRRASTRANSFQPHV